jgi:hypothetical protein
LGSHDPDEPPSPSKPAPYHARIPCSRGNVSGPLFSQNPREGNGDIL